MNSASALNDENVPEGEVLTYEVIGRQVKRARTAAVLSEIEDLDNIGQSQVGERAAKVVELSMEKMVNQPANQAGIVAAFGAAIHAACQPGGAISGAINAAIHAACQPGGPVRQAIRQELSGLEVRNQARYINSKISSSLGTIDPLPTSDGVVPENFPPTLGDFWAMNANSVNDLLLAYGLPTTGSVNAKKDRLALFCRLSRPIN